MLLSRSLHTDIIDADPQRSRNILTHLLNMWPHLRLLRDDRCIDIADRISFPLKHSAHDGQELQGIRPLIFLRSIRKMKTDIAHRSSAQQRVHDRVQKDICVRMSEKPFFIGDLHSAQDQLPALDQSVYIISRSNSDHFLSSSIKCYFSARSPSFFCTAVLIEGIIFVILTLTNVRTAIVNAIPLSMRKAIGAGIGLFIALIGLKSGGVVVANEATLVDLGVLTSGPGLLSVIGLIITGILVILNIPGALLIGIIATAVIGIPMGITQFHGVVDVPPSMSPIFFKFDTDMSQIFSLDMLVVVFTFLFVDMFDTIGTVVGVTTKAGMMDKNGNPVRMNQAFMADAIGTITGAMLGTSTVTTYVESASGVAQGGRSGLTAFSVVCCMVLALFFAPVFTAIPGSAVCPTLVIVGLFMLSPIKDIPLDDYAESIPAYLTVILMPMTYSISNGIMIGLISYVLLNLCSGRRKKVGWFMTVLAILFVLKYIFL